MTSSGRTWRAAAVGSCLALAVLVGVERWSPRADAPAGLPRLPEYVEYLPDDAAALELFAATHGLELEARQQHALLARCADERSGTHLSARGVPPYLAARYWWEIYRLVASDDLDAGALHELGMRFGIESGRCYPSWPTARR